MYRTELSTHRTTVLFLLMVDKFLLTTLLYTAKVFQHTHTIFLFIPCIQSFQPGTGIFRAFKAIVLFFGTEIDCTIYARFPVASVTAARTAVFVSLIRLAQGTVHPAGSQKPNPFFYSNPINYCTYPHARNHPMQSDM